MSKKVHYCDGRISYVPVCGTMAAPEDRTTGHARVTCRRCWFLILADVAPWARGFLDELRDRRGPIAKADDLRTGKRNSVSVPGTAAEPVNGKVKGLGNGFARAFAQQRSPQKAVSHFLPFQSTGRAPVQPVVDHGGAPAEPVGVKEGQVAEQAGDAGQVSDEAFWHY